MLGGAHEILVPGYDEALGLPDPRGHRTDECDKQILHHEAGIGRCADPLGGSEEGRAADRRAHRARPPRVPVVEEQGGMLAAIEADTSARR